MLLIASIPRWGDSASGRALTKKDEDVFQESAFRALACRLLVRHPLASNLLRGGAGVAIPSFVDTDPAGHSWLRLYVTVVCSLHTELPPVTTGALSDLVAQVRSTTSYDSILVPTTQIAVFLRAPTFGMPRFLAAKTTANAAEDVTYFYQKVGAQGEHLKFGITKNPATRYTQEELAGGRLRIIGQSERSEIVTV
jgi:hypothetical protein